jgi:Ala-tRNA(Pro) deacylase
VELSDFLAEHRIDAERFDHSPVMTVEQSERLVPKLPGAKTKNLFLRNKKGDRHFLITVPHDLAVDLNALGARLGAGRLGFASAERLQQHLGITPGSVSLLALANDAAHAVEFVTRPPTVAGGRRARAPAAQRRDDGGAARVARALSRGYRPSASHSRRRR